MMILVPTVALGSVASCSWQGSGTDPRAPPNCVTRPMGQQSGMVRDESLMIAEVPYLGKRFREPEQDI